MHLTKVISETEISFDWYEILDSFSETTKNEFNPRVYTIDKLADLAISVGNESGLSIHPADKGTLEKVCLLLSRAVSQYYNTEAEVTLCNDNRYFLQVKF